MALHIGASTPFGERSDTASYVQWEHIQPMLKNNIIWMLVEVSIFINSRLITDH